MKLARRFFALIVLVMLTASIVACGPKTPISPEPSSPPQAESAAVPESSARPTAKLPVIPWDLVRAGIAFDSEHISSGYLLVNERRATHIARDSIELGDEIICNLNIVSRSFIDGQCEIIIQYDGITIATHNIALKAKQTESLSFTLKPDVYGNHKVEVYLSDGHFLDLALFHVREPGDPNIIIVWSEIHRSERGAGTGRTEYDLKGEIKNIGNKSASVSNIITDFYDLQGQLFSSSQHGKLFNPSRPLDTIDLGGYEGRGLIIAPNETLSFLVYIPEEVAEIISMAKAYVDEAYIPQEVADIIKRHPDYGEKYELRIDFIEVETKNRPQ